MSRKKHWSDLSRSQQAGTVVIGAVQIGLQAWALWDIAHRSDAEINGNRKLWVAVTFVNFVGPIAYFVFGRRRASAPVAESAEAVSGEAG